MQQLSSQEIKDFYAKQQLYCLSCWYQKTFKKNKEEILSYRHSVKSIVNVDIDLYGICL